MIPCDSLAMVCDRRGNSDEEEVALCNLNDADGAGLHIRK
jgi:hypothetical protein